MRALKWKDWPGYFAIKSIRPKSEQIIHKSETTEQLIAQRKTVAAI
jgi:hypothetical protein